MLRAASRLATFTSRCRSKRKLLRAGSAGVRSSESHGIFCCSLAWLDQESATRARVCFHGRLRRISRTVGQRHQRIQRRLTRHSRGGPTACHQARATERVRPFSVARAWRLTVGLPLSSNVRRRTSTNVLRQHSNSNSACRLPPLTPRNVFLANMIGRVSQTNYKPGKRCSAHVLRRSRLPTLAHPQDWRQRRGSMSNHASGSVAAGNVHEQV
jgi:hypothetical protein